MSEIKWIKITTDVFDDEKIKLIETMPEGDSILIIWFKLLCKAGKTNNLGEMYLQQGMPYTDEMIATVFNRSLLIVRLALQTFIKFGMIEITDTETLLITNWEKHQNIEGMEQAKILNSLRHKRYNDKRKVLQITKKNEEMSLTQKNDTLDIDKELDKDIITAKNINEIVTLYHKICISLPTIIEVNDKRKAMIKARLKEKPSLDFWEQVFNKIEASAFLTGKQGEWKANFDWIFKNNTNYIKIMEGCYTKDNEIVKTVDLTHTKHRIEFEEPLEALTRLENDRV